MNKVGHHQIYVYIPLYSPYIIKSYWVNNLLTLAEETPPTLSGVAGYLLKSAVAFAVVGVCAYYGYRGYLETRVNTPFAAPAVVDKTGAARDDVNRSVLLF